MENSIILPIFNAEETLSLVIETLLRTLPEDSEIIVVDDCSTDNSSSIARAFPIIFVQQEENRGPSATRNTGARMAQGKNLIFIDSDVELEANALKNMLIRLEKNPDIFGVNGLPTERIP